ncbi:MULTISPECIES: TniB family NTP-binding protein [Agrobacterium]|uniref:TniB family NTP-binding protein n=1 Tax=Agrobacterium tumefaciens TaxID=358 RepID=UPI001574DC25|nr:AAA family ATPase [Agrobacterium tumefaciens]NSZ06343.1 AAA family ATPase [Agrobacterium tumefaciens]
MSIASILREKPEFQGQKDPNVQLVAASVARGLDDKNRRIMETMKRVKSAYLPTRNDQLSDIPFTRMKRAVAGMDQATFAVAIFAESGVGKSTHIVQRLKDDIAFEPVPDGYGNFLHPVLYVEAPQKASIIDLAEAMLQGMEYPVPPAKSENSLMKIVRRVLKRRGTRVVIIDEFQHVLDAPKIKGPTHVADAIKNLLQGDRSWPIFVVLVGLPEIKDIQLRDPKDQMLRRVDDFPLVDLTLEDDDKMIAELIIELVVNRAGLQMSGKVVVDFIERLLWGCHFRFGMVMELIYHAIEDALEHDDAVLSAHHWEEGYRRLVNGGYDADENVMAAGADWRKIYRPINRKGKFGPVSPKPAK